MPPRNEVHGKSLQRYSSVSPQEETARATYQRQISKAMLVRVAVRKKPKRAAWSMSSVVSCDPLVRTRNDCGA
jgi:hypothetical protein